MANSGPPRRIVVVGGGIAGVTAVRQLRSRGHDGPVSLVDPGEFPYDRPPLSKAFLLGEKDLHGIRLLPDDWFDENAVDLRAGRRVVRLRPGEGIAELDDGTELGADAVVLATGGTARPLPVPGGDREDVRTLRTVEDALRLREVLRSGATVVVVGGGLIGAEVASAALALGAQVTIVDPVALPLEHAVGPEIATILHAQHGTAGIRVVADSVAEIVGAAGSPVVVTARGESLPADLVLAGVGMVQASGVAAQAGLEVDRGIVVDAEQRTSNPAVFAAGDAVVRRGADGRPQCGEHWQAAEAGATAAVAALLGQAAPEPVPGWFWSDRHGVHVEVVGDLGGSRRLVRGDPDSYPLTVFALHDDGRVRGAAAIDDVKAIQAARRLITRGLVPDPDQLVDPAVDPRKLVRR